MRSYQPLGSVLKTMKGKKPKRLYGEPQEGLVPYLDLAAIETGVARQWADPRDAKVVSEGSLVMVWDGARSGWVGFAPFDGALGSTLSLLESSLNSRFLAAFLRGYFVAINANHRGSGIPHVNPDYLKALEVPILDDREQIAAARLAEGTLEKANTVRSHLSTARRAASRSRSAILVAAATGRLSSASRAQSADTSSGLVKDLAEERMAAGTKKPPLEPFIDDSLPSLPDEWTWVSADSVCGLITKGTTPAARLMSAESGEVPYLKVYNLTFAGVLDFSIRPTFVSRETHDGFLKRSRVYPGDVLMNIVGPPLGKVARVPADHDEWNINQAIAVFRPLPSMDSDFLCTCLLAPNVVGPAVRRAKATAGQHNLTLEICKEIALPLPPLNEQAEIVRQVKRLLAVEDAILQRLDRAERQVERSVPATLATLFRMRSTETAASQVAA